MQCLRPWPESNFFCLIQLNQKREEVGGWQLGTAIVVKLVLSHLSETLSAYMMQSLVMPAEEPECRVKLDEQPFPATGLLQSSPVVERGTARKVVNISVASNVARSMR
jgi:hypothetical protein